MKKALSTMLALMLALSLAACGGTTEAPAAESTPADNAAAEEATTEEEDEPGEEEAPAAGGSYTFGYIAYDMSDIWNEYSANAFEYAATQADEDITTVVLDSKNSLEDSITAMESLIQQQVDGITIFPISTEQGAQLVKMANDAGIPVTVENFAMDIDDPGDYLATVACEYDQIGYEAIKYIATDMPGARIFFCAGQEGAGVYEKYQEGVDRAMDEYGDQVEIVATQHADWLTDKAYDVTTGLIASGTEFDYIFANNGMMAKGCFEALSDAGMDEIPIVSTGGSPDDYDMMMDGIESANMTAPVSIQGIQTFKHLYDFVVLGQEPAEKFVSLPVIPVSADKAEEWIAWDDYEGAYNYVYGG